MGCAPGGLTMTACVGNKCCKTKTHLPPDLGFLLLLEQRSVLPTSWHQRCGYSGWQRCQHPALPVALDNIHSLPTPCPFPAGWLWHGGGTGTGFGGQPAALAWGRAPGSWLLRRGIRCWRQQWGAALEPRCIWAWRP